MKTASLRAPTKEEAWQKNRPAYLIHQGHLNQFADFLRERSLHVALPEDTGGWDRGIDLIVENEMRIDLKSFGLRESSNGRTFSWNSPHWKNRNPIYPGTLTDFFVHVNGPNVKDWYVGRRDGLSPSHRGSTPYYYSDDVYTVEEWLT